MIYVKDNPIGIDEPIQRCQKILNDNLSWNGYDIYGRLYTNYKGGSKIVEAYIGGKEYVEAFNDDTIAKIGFIVSPVRTGIDGNVVEVTLLCSCDVKKIYGVEQREDEAALMEVLGILGKVPSFKVLNVKSGNVNDIFSEFMDTKAIMFRDMQPFCNFSIRCKVTYFNNICNFK